ncbi:hypothetical protein L209DRAFT_542001 [Thermothelomyces heterothallicus CBS 203.75]
MNTHKYDTSFCPRESCPASCTQAVNQEGKGLVVFYGYCRTQTYLLSSSFFFSFFFPSRVAWLAFLILSKEARKKTRWKGERGPADMYIGMREGKQWGRTQEWKERQDLDFYKVGGGLLPSLCKRELVFLGVDTAGVYVQYIHTHQTVDNS